MPHPSDTVTAQKNARVVALLAMPAGKYDLNTIAGELGWDRERTQSALRDLGIR